MGNAPKRNTRGVTPVITDELKQFAGDLGFGPEMTLSVAEVFLMQKCAELDQRRQIQVRNQIEAINRLVAALIGVENITDRDEDQGMPPIVYKLGNSNVVAISAPLTDDVVTIELKQQ